MTQCCNVTRYDQLNILKSRDLFSNLFQNLFETHDMPPQKRRKQKKDVSKKVISNETIKRRRNSYSVEQKKQIVTYAKENGIIKAANYFELDKGMVSCWVKSNEK